MKETSKLIKKLGTPKGNIQKQSCCSFPNPIYQSTNITRSEYADSYKCSNCRAYSFDSNSTGQLAG